MLKAKCGSCGIIKTQFVKGNEGGKFDIHKAMLPLLPKTGLHFQDIDIVVLVIL